MGGRFTISRLGEYSMGDVTMFSRFHPTARSAHYYSTGRMFDRRREPIVNVLKDVGIRGRMELARVWSVSAAHAMDWLEDNGLMREDLDRIGVHSVAVLTDGTLSDWHTNMTAGKSARVSPELY